MFPPYALLHGLRGRGVGDLGGRAVLFLSFPSNISFIISLMRFIALGTSLGGVRRGACNMAPLRQTSQSSIPSVLRPARDWTMAASPGGLKAAVP